MITTVDRFAAVDVQYSPTGGARAALVIASDRHFAHIVEERAVWIDEVAPYEPGNFFVRELPCITAVLAQTDVTDLALMIVDGYVDLDPHGRPGLGAHVHERLGVPVVGVAKTAFQPATHAIAVRRGTATRPLFVTATGLPIEQAASDVAAMAGPYRMPDALRRVDALARGRA